MSDPNIIDSEYNEFLKVFNGCWPTNYEFFLAACNWQKQKQEKAQGEPVGEMVSVEVPSHSMNRQFSIEPDLYADVELPVGAKLYTSAPTIPEGWQLVPVEPTEAHINAVAIQFDLHPTSIATLRGVSFYKAMLAAAPKHKETK